MSIISEGVARFFYSYLLPPSVQRWNALDSSNMLPVWLATDPDLSPLTFCVQGLEARIIAPHLCLQSRPCMAFIENWRRMEISYFKTCLYLLELVWVWFTSVANGEQFSGIISLFPHGSSQHRTQAWQVASCSTPWAIHSTGRQSQLLSTL